MVIQSLVMDPRCLAIDVGRAKGWDARNGPPMIIFFNNRALAALKSSTMVQPKPRTLADESEHRFTRIVWQPTDAPAMISDALSPTIKQSFKFNPHS